MILFTNSNFLDCKVFSGDIATIRACVAAYAKIILQERHRLQKRKGIEIPQRGYQKEFSDHEISLLDLRFRLLLHILFLIDSTQDFYWIIKVLMS